MNDRDERGKRELEKSVLAAWLDYDEDNNPAWAEEIGLVNTLFSVNSQGIFRRYLYAGIRVHAFLWIIKANNSHGRISNSTFCADLTTSYLGWSERSDNRTVSEDPNRQKSQKSKTPCWLYSLEMSKTPSSQPDPKNRCPGFDTKMQLVGRLQF